MHGVLAAQRTEVATGRAVLNRALTSGPGVRPTPKHATIADSIKDPIASNFLSVHQCRGWGWRATLLYDAVVVLSSAASTTDMLMRPTARDFVADAFAHCKFIGYTEATLGAVQEGRNS